MLKEKLAEDLQDVLDVSHFNDLFLKRGFLTSGLNERPNDAGYPITSVVTMLHTLI